MRDQHFWFDEEKQRFAGQRQLSAHFSDDVHMIIRQLFHYLPKEHITKPTRTSSDVTSFTQRYGVRIGKRLRQLQPPGIKIIDGQERADPQQLHVVVRAWLMDMVTGNPGFEWEGFSMTSVEMNIAVDYAFQDWLWMLQGRLASTPKDCPEV